MRVRVFGAQCCIAVLLCAVPPSAAAAGKTSCGQMVYLSPSPDCPVVDQFELPACPSRPAEVLAAFGVVGNTGGSSSCSAQAAKLLDAVGASFDGLQFVLSTGDQTHPSGTCAEHVAQTKKDYGAYFSPGECSDERLDLGSYNAVPVGSNRFFPVPGPREHWSCRGPPLDARRMPFARFFNYLGELEPEALPRTAGTFYQHSVLAGVDVFGIDSAAVLASPAADVARIKAWAEQAIRGSDARWKLVVMHHPPYTSARSPAGDAGFALLQWEFGAWGASAVFSGHVPAYERITSSGDDGSEVYVVNGLGGGQPGFADIEAPECGSSGPTSQVRFNRRHGVVVGMLSADAAGLSFCAYGLPDPQDTADRAAVLIDSFSLLGASTGEASPLPTTDFPSSPVPTTESSAPSTDLPSKLDPETSRNGPESSAMGRGASAEVGGRTSAAPTAASEVDPVEKSWTLNGILMLIVLGAGVGTYRWAIRRRARRGFSRLDDAAEDDW